MNIQDVPLDVISHIFEFLNVEEVGMRCSLVCQTWKEAASSAICWHVFYCRDIDAVPFTDADDWKQKYRTDFGTMLLLLPAPKYLFQLLMPLLQSSTAGIRASARLAATSGLPRKI